MKDNFIGKWILLPEESKYERGIPPEEATYTFQEGENGSLHVSIVWTNNEGDKSKIHYNIIPDGQKKKYENPQMADQVMSEFKTEKHLNSYTYKAGKVIAFASRIIDEKGKMEVIQRFFSPDGKSFDNVQYYEKDGGNSEG